MPEKTGMSNDMDNLTTTDEQRQKSDKCPECRGFGCVEVHAPFIYGCMIHKMVPCRECAGRGRLRRQNGPAFEDRREV